MGAFRIFRILDFECFEPSAFSVAGAAASQQRPATSPGPISWSSRAKEASHHLGSNHMMTFDQYVQFFNASKHAAMSITSRSKSKSDRRGSERSDISK